MMDASDSQTELFQEGPGGPIDLVPEAYRWTSLADRLPPGVRLGTSSWSFPGWHGVVYDRAVTEATLARHGLEAYARHPLFRAVGLDRSYYQPLSRHVYAHYAAQVPDDFRFLVKMERRLTLPDAEAFLNPDQAWRWVLEPALEGLGDRMGVILLQFPPMLPAHVGGAEGFASRLDGFLSALSCPIPIAVELRTQGLFTETYGRVLQDRGASHSYVVHPSMPTIADQVKLFPPDWSPHRVVRWMLASGRTYEGARDAWRPFDRLRAPDPETRGAVAALIRGGASASPSEGTMVIVNNKAEGSSPRSIEALVEVLLGDAS